MPRLKAGGNKIRIWYNYGKDMHDPGRPYTLASLGDNDDLEGVLNNEAVALQVDIMGYTVDAMMKSHQIPEAQREQVTQVMETIWVEKFSPLFDKRCRVLVIRRKPGEDGQPRKEQKPVSIFREDLYEKLYRLDNKGRIDLALHEMGLGDFETFVHHIEPELEERLAQAGLVTHAMADVVDLVARMQADRAAPKFPGSLPGGQDAPRAA